MAQASGKSGHYRYYKCTTRLNKGISRCDSRNLPREQTDALVLTALAKRRRAARTVEDARLLVLTKELDSATKALNRLYEAVEQALLPMDDTLRSRAQKLQARRNEALLEMAKLEDRNRQGLPKVDASRIEAFSKVLEARLKDIRNGFGKAYLRLLIDEIRLDSNELKIRGSYHQLGEAFGLLEEMKLGEVPSFIRD